MNIHYNVYLSSKEVLLLDGKVDAKIQKEVDKAKDIKAIIVKYPSLSESEALLVWEVLEEAKTQKKLCFQNKRLTKCDHCGNEGTYPVYKSGPRKGEEKHDAPKSGFCGYEMANRFISIMGWASVGCCAECWKKLQPVVSDALKGIPCEVNEQLTGRPNEYKRWNNVKCTKCEWTGHEGEMGKLHAMMGGYYPGKCPKCGVENLPFGRTIIETTSGYSLTPVEVKKDAETKTV